MNDVDTEVHLFSIHDDALDVYSYPVMSTFSDLKNFLSARMECDYSVFPEFFKYPDQYSVYDCGTYDALLSNGSNNPYNAYSHPRFVGRLIDFRGGDDNGKSASTNKDI